MKPDPNAPGDNRLTGFVVPTFVLIVAGLLAYDLASLLFMAMDAWLGNGHGCCADGAP